MRVLVYSLYGDSGGIAYQMQKEGAKVDLFVKDAFYRRQMSGLVPHVETLEEGLAAKPDFVLFDLNGEGKVADEVRRKGFRVIGGSELADRLEMDRSYGGKVAQQYGIKTPKTTEFNDVLSAISFVKKTGKAYAIKIDNNKSESSSYVGKSADDLVDYLEHAREEKTIGAGDTFILQEVVKGAEISTEVWFSGGTPLWPANSTFETKKFLAGELGQRTGCEVSLVYHYDGMQSRIVDKTIRKIFPLLKYAKWTGPIDVNCIVSEDDHEPYFLEWTPRLGYSAIYAYLAILGIPISEFFFRVTRGPFTIPFKSVWGTSLKLSIPPYPAEIEDKKAANETYGKTEGTRINGKYGADFIPIDCQKGKGSTELMSAGTSCILGECLGRGKTPLDAWRASQKVFKSVEVPNQQGRYTDGLEDPFKRAKQLKEWGYDVPISAGTKTLPLLSKVPA
jgi:phosphoribosylamine--glycine ligase